MLPFIAIVVSYFLTVLSDGNGLIPPNDVVGSMHELTKDWTCRDSSWNVTSDICSWAGVSCDEDGLASLFVWKRMSCTATSVPLNFSLLPPSLKQLSLNGNGFSGTFNSTLLPQSLTLVSLDDNHFSGSLNLSALPQSLTYFSMDNNQFTGTIDFEPLSLPLLSELFLSGNRLEGSLTLSHFPRSLTKLHMSSNRLSGSLDLSGLPPDLIELHLGSNNLSGTLNLTALPQTITWLSLGHNMLNGTVEFSGLPRALSALYLNDNNFTGTVDLATLPLSLSRSLTKIHIHHNQFSGSLNLAALPRLVTYFSVSANNFSGNLDFNLLPKVISAMDFSYNHFCGTFSLPSVLPQYLSEVNLIENEFCGTVSLRPASCSAILSTNMCRDQHTQPTGSCLLQNLSCPVCDEKATSPPQTKPVPLNEPQNTTTTMLGHQNDQVFSTASSVMTVGGSMLFVSPDVVMMSQLVEYAVCKHSDGMNSRRPILITLSRVVSQHPQGNIQLQHTFEIMMFFVTLAIMYIANGFAAIIMLKTRMKKAVRLTPIVDWLCSMKSLKYPAFVLRFHLSHVLPMVSLCTASVALGSSPRLSVFIVLSICVYVSVLIVVCIISYRGAVYTASANENNDETPHLTKLVTSQGRWTPEVCVTTGGVFFASYTTIKCIPPYVWVWMTMCVGLAMTITGTLVEEVGSIDVDVCTAVAVSCGCVVMMSGILHVAWRNT
eukprot:PhF_6_TR13391/c1_g2_i1/m.21273